MLSIRCRSVIAVVGGSIIGALACGGDNSTGVGPATKLVFAVQPSVTEVTQAIAPAVRIEVRDQLDRLAPSATDAVTLTLANNPSGATLSGTLTANAAAGVASFIDVRVDRPGTGYTLAAAATGLTGATSASFTVRATFSTVDAGGAAAGGHTCGVTTSRAVFCWGQNARGQIGNDSLVIQFVPALAQAPPGVTFGSVSAGGQHTCAVTPSGKVYCWGRNANGRLGDGTMTDRLTPVRVVAPAGVTFTSVSAGSGHTCGLSDAGAAYCWGFNIAGQLGDSTTTDRLTPVLANPPTGVTFVAVHAGGRHSCALATSGAAYCWGDNSVGQLGDNTTIAKLTPVQVVFPTGVTSFSRIDAGALHTCALTPAGEAYCWGGNDSGQLGDNSTTGVLAPVLVKGGLVFSAVSTGVGHTCAVTTMGAGYCWGQNSNGQLGDGTQTQRLTPTPILGGLVLDILTTGVDHSCGHATAVPNVGVYCWGGNASGELGDGTTTQRLVPTRASQ